MPPAAERGCISYELFGYALNSSVGIVSPERQRAPALRIDKRVKLNYTITRNIITDKIQAQHTLRSTPERKGQSKLHPQDSMEVIK